jgi:homopolymeric O-antigen transport system permease protein
VSLQSAARSMIDSAELIKKVRFPRQLVAFSMVATQAVTFAVMIAILIGLSLVFIPEARDTVWLAIPLGAVFVAFVAGFALLLATLNVLFRDVEHILTAALLPWFFLTPVLWDPANLAAAQRHHALLDVLRWGNPVTPPIYAVRDALWLGHPPRAADVVYTLVAAATMLVLASVVFNAADDRIAVEL